MSTEQQTTERDSRSMLPEMSNAMVALFKEFFGRGPTQARTDWAGPDTLVVTLENTLTLAERKLVSMGEHHRLRDTHMHLQDATTPEFCEPVERITGRKVRSFIGGIDTGIDLSVQVFVLHPDGYDGPSPTDLHLSTATTPD
jgi:uncharacterized protein YbcI